jgi:uncharacterized repeat protein (TIGR03943 family)
MSAVSSFVLASWAGLFWFVLLTDRTNLYLSDRTAWVVPVGAAVLTIAALGKVAALRAGTGGTPSPKNMAEAAFLILPVVIVLALPTTTLGAFAASRRSTLGSGAYGASPEEIAKGELSLADVAGALRTQGGLKALVSRASETVTFVGFVTRDAGAPVDEFTLNRFLVSCCVADAVAVQVRVVGTPAELDLQKDQWVSVTGSIYPLQSEVVIKASEIRKVERPKRPYLSV